MKGIAMTGWHEKLLEELVYERVMLHIDLLDLMDFERELSDGIERAMRDCGATPVQQDVRARQLLDQAWRRVEREWARLHEEPDRWDQCPLCDGPFQCPDPPTDRPAVD